MTTKAIDVAREIVERTRNDVGTHYGTCYTHHLTCFALLVLEEAEAAEAAK